MVKNLLAVLETWVHSLDQEDRLEKGSQNIYSGDGNGYLPQYFARISWTEKPVGHRRVGHG